MAGTVHEVENHALLAEVEREAANAAQELVEAARLHRGQIVVIGCSSRYTPTLGNGPEWLPSPPLATPRM